MYDETKIDPKKPKTCFVSNDKSFIAESNIQLGHGFFSYLSGKYKIDNNKNSEYTGIRCPDLRCIGLISLIEDFYKYTFNLGKAGKIGSGNVTLNEIDKPIDGIIFSEMDKESDDKNNYSSLLEKEIFAKA